MSSSLVCDGINHCPSSDEYNSDEDAAICSRQKGANDNSVIIIVIVRKLSIYQITHCLLIPQCTGCKRHEHLATNNKGAF